MSLEVTGAKPPVHFPANPTKFEFDKEVSAVFDDMAKRSIPNFYEAHDAHARMLRPWFNKPIKVLDVGASRGAFFKALKKSIPKADYDQASLYAIDTSQAMCDYMTQELPEVKVLRDDATEFLKCMPKNYFDVICANYVVQFLPENQQNGLITRMCDSLVRGGVLIIGHKAMHYGTSGDLAHEEYIEWRVNNGYTREEIAAKTLALRNSMFPMPHQFLMRILSTRMSEVQETFRYMMFSTIFAVK